MSKLELVKKDLLGQEMNFYELDNKMVELGYISESNSGVWNNCLQDGNIVYSETTDKLGNTKPTIQIFFEVVIKAGKEEISEATMIKITSIEKF